MTWVPVAYAAAGAGLLNERTFRVQVARVKRNAIRVPRGAVLSLPLSNTAMESLPHRVGKIQ